MELRSKLVGVLLVPFLVLVACTAHAQTQAPREGRDAISEIDAGIDRHARQMLETGRRVEYLKSL
jgi:hypothetical protein